MAKDYFEILLYSFMDYISYSFTGLSHSGNRRQWLKMNGGPKTISVRDFAGTINNFLQSGTGPYTFWGVKIKGATVNISTSQCSFPGPVSP